MESNSATTATPDPTESRRARQQIEFQTRLLEQVLDSIVAVDREFRITYLNRAAEHLFGWSVAEALNQPYGIVAGTAVTQAERQAIHAEIFNRGSWNGEIICTNRDGAKFVVHVSWSVLRDDTGNPQGVAGIHRDITAPKQMEQALRLTQDRFKLAQSALSLGTWEIDDNSGTVECSEQMLHLYGISEPHERLTLEQWHRYVHPDDRERKIAERKAHSQDHESFDRQYRVIWPDGSIHWLHSKSLVIFDEQGKAARFIGVDFDISEQKRLEAELAAAKEAAEAASRTKSEFLANMSHEIRTPMNGVLGMTELALETELSEEQREYLNTVKLSADSLLTVINDILDFSKIEAGKLELDPTKFRVRDLIEDTAKILAFSAHQKGLELVCDIDASAPDFVVGDSVRMRQILVNLIGNAVKFTDQGEVILTVKSDPPDPPIGSGLELHFSVRDTGVGIAPEKVSTIFQAFAQADGSTTRRYGGTGLGLTISKRLAEMMGGRIGVDSQPGRGSTFWFTVRATVPELSTLASLDNVSLVGVPVLIVDDHATTRRILAGTVAKWGMRPVVAESALAAIELFASMAESIPLILTDVHMPDMDGFELVQHITGRAQTPTIVMLTSGSHVGDAARCRELGIETYLVKPVAQQELRSAIIRALKLRAPQDTIAAVPAAQGASRGSGAGQASARSLRILLAEDNVVNQKVAVRLLEKEGHSILVVGNGREAVAALEREPFQLVLMDIQMPEMGGLEATAAIRARERYSGGRLPIIAMTAHAMTGDEERCLTAGMDGYIAKPVHKANLLATIERVVAMIRAIE